MKYYSLPLPFFVVLSVLYIYTYNCLQQYLSLHLDATKYAFVKWFRIKNSMKTRENLSRDVVVIGYYIKCLLWYKFFTILYVSSAFRRFVISDNINIFTRVRTAERERERERVRGNEKEIERNMVSANKELYFKK